MLTSNNITDTLLELNITSRESNEALIALINQEINKYKLKNLSAWVRNHNVDSTETKSKIKELEDMKADLLTSPEDYGSRCIKLIVE